MQPLIDAKTLKSLIKINKLLTGLRAESNELVRFLADHNAPTASATRSAAAHIAVSTKSAEHIMRIALRTNDNLDSHCPAHPFALCHFMPWHINCKLKSTKTKPSSTKLANAKTKPKAKQNMA
jgi:hypothetical protein